MERPEVMRRPARNRAAGVEPVRPTPRGREAGRDGLRTQKSSGTGGLPVVPTLVAFVLAIALTAYVTRSMVLSSVGDTVSAGVAEAATAAPEASEGASQVQIGDGGGAPATNEAAPQETSSESPKSDGPKSGDGVKSPWISSGTFATGDATLDEEVKKFCDGIATTDMDIDTAALEVYKGVAWSDYVERDDAQHPAGKDWRIEYARQYYENDCTGNCYEFAAFLGYCLQYLGFADAHSEAVILELKSGDWGDHGLVYVTNTDGTPSLCDTSLGTNGWMLKDTAYNVQIQDVENA